MSSGHGRADSHIHLFRDGFTEDARDELAWYEELRRGSGVSAALVVGYEGEPRFAGNNKYILDLSRHLPWVRPTAYVDVAAPPPAESLRAHRDDGFVGWSVYLPDTGPSLADWSADRLAAFGGGILSVNASPTALSGSAEALASLTGTRVLVSHLGSPGPVVQDAARVRARLAPLLALAEHPHVSVKLSGLYAIDPIHPHDGARSAVDAVLAAFGPGRLAWGSDFSPVATTVDPADAMTPPDIVLAGLSHAATAAILGGTLLRHLAHVDSIGRSDA